MTQLELVEAAKKGELTGAQREILATGQTYSPSTHRRVKNQKPPFVASTSLAMHDTYNKAD